MIRCQPSADTKSTVVRLLTAGMSQVSVFNLMRNNGVQITQRAVRELAKSLVASVEPVETPPDVVGRFRKVPKFRCPGCGGLSVISPCRKCMMVSSIKTRGKYPPITTEE